MDQNRKFWNQQQQSLRKALSSPGGNQEAIRLFLDQHAMVHTAGISRPNLWSFEDEIWQGLNDKDIRAIPNGFEHSIAWMVWHTSRIEDITMNMLVADCPQLFFVEGWHDRLGVPFLDTGNAMNPVEIKTLSDQVNINVLHEYRSSIGSKTRQIVSQLTSSDLKERVDPARLQCVYDEGAVVAEAKGLLDYWGGLTIAGLLLMPPTRHPFVHWNEAKRVKGKIIKSDMHLG